MSSMSTKKMFIGGNWKCNGTKASTAKLVELLNGAGAFADNAEVVVAPTALHLGAVQEKLRPDIQVAAQNLWEQPAAGAWTGELTVDIIKDFGINWAIIGHSERRAYCGETPEKVGVKVDLALTGGLKVIPCFGESKEQRESGKYMDTIIAQLEPIVAAVPKGAWDRVVLAYEPVWAIGTGLTASPAQAQETHMQIREWLATKIGAEVAANLRIIYGGSVKGANCDELMGQPDIDGFLVGGAALKEEFIKIINSAGTLSKM